LKKIISFLIKLLVSIFLLYFLFRKIEIERVIAIVNQLDKKYLLLSFSIFFLAYIIGVFRWGMLLNMAEVKYDLKRLVIVSFGSNFFNLIVPSTIGADIVRSLDLGAHTKNLKTVAATVFLDRLSGYIALALISSVSLLLGHSYIHNIFVYLVIGLLAVLSVTILFFLFNPWVAAKLKIFSKNKGKLNEKIDLLYREIHLFRKHPKLLCANLGLSILIQLVIPIVYYLLSLALKIDVSIIGILVIVPVITFISAIPVSIGGLGVREWSSGIFLTQLGISQEIGVTLSLVNFFFLVVFSVAAGIVYVITFRSRRI